MILFYFTMLEIYDVIRIIYLIILNRFAASRIRQVNAKANETVRGMRFRQCRLRQTDSSRSDSGIWRLSCAVREWLARISGVRLRRDRTV